MSQVTLERPRAARHGKVQMPIVDGDLHHYFPSDDVILKFLDPRWHDHHKKYGARGYQPTKFPTSPYPRSAGGGRRRDAAPPSGLPIGSDVDFFIEQVIEPLNIEYGVLNLSSAAGTCLHSGYDAAFARAANTFTRDMWLNRDDRFRASICIPYEDADLAVAEIEHWKEDRRFVQCYFRARTAQPIGRKQYWPIFEAAERSGITIGMHLGGLSAFPIGGSGWPSYYVEDHTLNAVNLQSQVLSLICEGVFDRFPKLKFVAIECGVSWLAPLMWRMDKQWKRLRSEMPNLTRLPSEVIREHIRLTTQPMEEPHKPEQLLQAIEHVGEDAIMFSTDYPHWDFDNPERAFQIELPAPLKKKILHENARKVWKLSPRSGSRA